MASPAQKYRFSGLSEFTAEQYEQLDEMLEDLYTYISQSPLGISDAALDLSELELDAGLLTVDEDGVLSSLPGVGVVFVDTDGVGFVVTPGTTGAFLRQGTTDPEWSALTLPNAAAIGDLWYASTTAIISRLADVATGNALISGGVGVAPAYGKIGLTTHVSGILPVANGGTNNSTALTTGSVIYFDGTRYQQDNAGLFFDAANNRLGIGTAAPSTALHLASTGSIELRLESDTDNSDESHQARILFSQDGGLVTARIGFLSGGNEIEITTVEAGSGGHGNIIFRANSVTRQTLFSSGGIQLLGTMVDPGAGILLVDGQIKITGGTPAAGQVLTSDANGLATWEPAAGSSEPTEQTTTSTGTQNDFSLSAAYTLLRCNNASDLTLTGFTVGGVAPTAGDRVIIVSVGAGKVLLSHQVSSTAANRLINFATSGLTPLAAGTGVAAYIYDDTTDRWRLIAHEQGAWITPTFAAGDYTASGAMTWTVESADVLGMAYRLSGRTLFVGFRLNATSVGGVVSTDLQISNAAYGGFTAGVAALSAVLCGDNAVQAFANALVVGGGTNIFITKVPQTTFTLSTNATLVFGVVAFEVT